MSEVEKNKAKNKFEFRITSIKKLRYFQNEYSMFGLDLGDIKRGFVKLKAHMKIEKQKGILSIFLNVNFSTNKEQKEYELFGIETVHSFQLRNFSKLYVVAETDTFEIPDELMILFINVSVSGTRGMLVALNTIQDYSNIILPVIYPGDLLGELKKEFKTKAKVDRHRTTEKTI